MIFISVHIFLPHDGFNCLKKYVRILQRIGNIAQVENRCLYLDKEVIYTHFPDPTSQREK